MKAGDKKMVTPVVLCGGEGTRLWPLSGAVQPKPFLSLMSEKTLFQETLLRCDAGGKLFTAPWVVCHQRHRFLVGEQAQACGVALEKVVLEPHAKNTAPAALTAALLALEQDVDALMLFLPADHVIADVDAFHAAVQCGIGLAEKGHLVLFGVTPNTVQEGYGYIRAGEAVGEGAHHVAAFVEKPGAEVAVALVQEGGVYWNSGIFLCTARYVVEALQRLQPQMVKACRAAILKGKQEQDFFWLDDKIYADLQAVSFDYACLEQAKDAVVVPVEMGWSDIGSWTSIWGASVKDKDNNAIVGNAELAESQACYIHSEGPLVAGVGLEEMVIVATEEAMLVAPRSRDQEVKALYQQIKQRKRVA